MEPMPTLSAELDALRAYHAAAIQALPEALHPHARKGLKSAHEAVMRLLEAHPETLAQDDVARLAEQLTQLADDVITPGKLGTKWPDPKFTYAYTVRAMQAALAREVYLAAARELQALLAHTEPR